VNASTKVRLLFNQCASILISAPAFLHQFVNEILAHLPSARFVHISSAKDDQGVFNEKVMSFDLTHSTIAGSELCAPISELVCTLSLVLVL
jgi:hypothetical protein